MEAKLTDAIEEPPGTPARTVGDVCSAGRASAVGVRLQVFTALTDGVSASLPGSPCGAWSCSVAPTGPANRDTGIGTASRRVAGISLEERLGLLFGLLPEPWAGFWAQVDNSGGPGNGRTWVPRKAVLPYKDDRGIRDTNARSCPG